MIVDHKTCAKIPFDSFQGKKMATPLEDIEDSKGLAYSLQLNLYKYLIERNSTFKVVKMAITHIPRGGEEKIIHIAEMQDEIKRIMENPNT